MEINSCFYKLNSDNVNDTSTILEYIVDYLKDKKGIEGYGEVVSYSTRPWVLVFCSNIDPIKAAISKALTNKRDDLNIQTNKKWLEALRLCVVKNLNELKIMLSCIHLKPANEINNSNKKRKTDNNNNDLLTWMMKEKQGQPPVMIVVINLLELLLTYGPNGKVPQDAKYLYIRFDELAGILALLTETCVYFSTSARETWEQPFDISTKTTTDLLITDNGCLRDINELKKQYQQNYKQNSQSSSTSSTSLTSSYEELDVLEKLYRIITYYLGNIV
ncbi:unnamed protein product [Cunninghamella blakesleeana]